ncbi:MAG: restriction endonuclease subunit S [Dehalococcoidia bacterium]|nr:restriction endonuclease subunit S [Dehalococcoidia bacterium]
MTDRLSLPPRHRRMVEDLLREHVPDAEVWAYGSRVNGESHEGSDLDLVVRGPALEPLGVEFIDLVEALQESNIPILVQAHDWANLPDGFHTEIKRDYVVVQGVATPEGANGWREVTLGEACTKIGSGATPRGGRDVYLEHGPFALIRSQNVHNDGFHRDGLAFIGEHHAAELEGVEVFEGDVLLNITGDSVARVCQVASDVLPARVNQHVAIIRPSSDSLDAGYLRYHLVSPETQALLLSWAGSGGTRNALTKGMLESLEVPLPPLSEQRAIAHVLGTLDDKIELNRRMNETLEAMARALFKSWFVDFEPVRAKMEGRWHRGESLPGLPAEHYDLFPDRLVNSELGEIPEGWGVKALGDVANLNPESWSRTNHPSNLEYVDLANTKWGTIESTQHILWKDAPSRAKRVLRSGDTVIGTVRPGNGAYSFIGMNGLTGSTGFAVLRPVHPRFREFVYLSATVKENIERLAHRADGGAYPAVRPNVVAETEVVLPAVEADLLDWFSGTVSPVLDRVESNKRESRFLAAQRDVLLPRLVSGEVRVEGHLVA